MSERVRLILVVAAVVGVCLLAWRLQMRDAPNETPLQVHGTSAPQQEAEIPKEDSIPIAAAEPEKISEEPERTVKRGIFGRIISDEGVPINKATLTLISERAEKKTQRTDAKGEFAFSGNGRETYQLRVEAAGYAPRHFDHIQVSKKSLDLSVLKFATIEGNVVAAAGRQPVKSFSYFVRNELYHRPPQDKDLTYVEDPEGAFSIDGIHPESHATLWIRASGYAEKATEFRTPKSGGTRSDFLIQLDRGNNIRGRVMNETSTPIHDALVFRGIVPLDEEAREANDKVVSDGFGNFVIAGLSLGDHQISAYKEGYQYVQKVVDVVEGGSEVTLTLIEGGTLNGTVFLQGTPVPNASVTATIHSARIDGEAYAAGARTDERGRFTITGVAGGTGTIEVNFTKNRLKRNKVQPVEVAVGGTTDIAFEFSRPQSSLEGYLMLTENKPTSGRVQLLIDSDGTLERHSVTVRADGFYSFESLPPGNVYLKAFGPRIKGERTVQGVLHPNETLQLDLLLYSGSDLTCYVENIPKKTHPVAMVLSDWVEVPATLNLDQYEQLSDKAFAVVNVMNESVEIKGVEPGTYTITIIAVPSSSSSNLENMQTTTVSPITITDEPEQEIELSF
jgi:hypothetical protein